MFFVIVFLTALLGIGVAVVLWRDIHHRSKGKKQSLIHFLSHYLTLRVLAWLGYRQRQLLEYDTKNVYQVQHEILLQRLKQNQNTEYGQKYKFSEIQDRVSFRKVHPLTRYNHYSDYIQRISHGEENVLISEIPSMLAMTSGVPGSSAVVPNTRVTAIDYFMKGIVVCLDAMYKAFPGTQNLQKIAKFTFTPRECRLESGIPVGSYVFSHTINKHLLNLYSTPAPALNVMTESDTLYVNLLFALQDRTLGMLEDGFASAVYYACVTLQQNWESLTEDIEIGQVNSELKIPRNVQQELNSVLKPDPVRASELRREFEKGFHGIARRIWPDLQVVWELDSGYEDLHGKNLKEFYCKGISFYSPVYATSEGLIGVNLWPEKPDRRYLLCPRSVFCEFIPVATSEEEQPSTLFMEEVKEDEEYELVLTNASGLYRYRIGDVVKVVGFHSQCPIVEFKYRKNQTLNVRGEKISEQVLYQALQYAVKLWPGAELIDYCCAENSILGPYCGASDPHYEVIVELKGIRNLSEDQRYKLDECLQKESGIYKSFRFKGSIGPVRVHLVGPGAFKELYSFIRAHGSLNQFKIHRVLQRKEFWDFIYGKVVS